MENLNIENIQITSLSVVKQAARNFAAALSETPQFAAFEQAAYAFHQDHTAQKAMQAFQEKQMALRAMIMLNALSAEQRKELESLQSNFINLPVVKAYVEAQSELASLCQILGGMLSKSIGLNYAAACGASCCG